MSERCLEIADDTAMRALGAALARALPPGGLVIHLQGDLGAGKTTLARGLLQALGVGGHVRSPTYTLVEPYELADRTLAHLDLYRLADPEELEWLGLRDLMAEDAVLLIEWPERGQGFLPTADLLVAIEHAGDGRRVCLRAGSQAGERLLASLEGLTSTQ